MQGGVERPRLHLERILGVGIDRVADAVAMLRAPAQRLQDDEVERSLQQIDAALITAPRHVDNLQPGFGGCQRPTPQIW